ncbi:MAG: HU family DNA-binding protein [Clostridium sp.]
MNKTELVEAIVAKTEGTKKNAELHLAAFLDVVTEALQKEEKIQLVGFGTFEVRRRAKRKGRNPQTNEEMIIPASKAPVFKAGKALKDKVNK